MTKEQRKADLDHAYLIHGPEIPEHLRQPLMDWLKSGRPLHGPAVIMRATDDGVVIERHGDDEQS